MRKLIAIMSALALTCLMPVIPAVAQNGPVYCNQFAQVNPTSATTTKVISKAGTGPQRILICGYVMQAIGGTAQLEYGTGGTCGTGTTTISPLFAAAAVGQEGDEVWRGLAAPAGNDVCVVTGTSTTASTIIIYWTYGT